VGRLEERPRRLRDGVLLLLVGDERFAVKAVGAGAADLHFGAVDAQVNALRVGVGEGCLVSWDFTRWPVDLRASIHLGQSRSVSDALLLDAARAAGAGMVVERVRMVWTRWSRARAGAAPVCPAGSGSGLPSRARSAVMAWCRGVVVFMLDEPASVMDPRAE
jgi:hypothetical protein